MNRERDLPERDRSLDRTRERTLNRSRSFSSRDWDAVRDIGDFGMVRPKDLAVGRYDGDRHAMERSIQSLRNAGYVRRYTVVDERVRTNRPIEILVLTNRGRSALYRMDDSRRVNMAVRPDGQLKRSTEAAHDLSIYPAVMRIKERIEDDGGKVMRVHSGAEFTSSRARMANQKGDGRSRNTSPNLKRQKEIAEALNLEVVRGRVLIPDARVVYRDREGQERHIDVEITTPSYSGGDKSDKREAGFHLVTGVSFTSSKVIRDHRHR